MNIFRHVIKCGECKASLLFEMNKNPKGIQYSYFHCHTRKEIKGKCNQPRFRFEYALGILLELVKNATENPNYIGEGYVDPDYID
ncbi:zinc ribbon domain-containing protein, partial [Pseudomonas sp. HY7a-MNA-CIBAN-0227]|uniref:zinc ribbon domain-containing protein n=1 Tax=Pseudomonas sp. HY7a-MNA-CIBAN-0227 TaxID=3140474 RepID=UPI0033299F63